MSSEKNKWIDAVARLITLTQERKLIWRARNEYESEGPRTIYEADYGDKLLRLRGYKSLYLVDKETDVEWDFPESEAISHLMEAVKYQVVRARDFLNELLARAG
jgi:hypothetical protein